MNESARSPATAAPSARPAVGVGVVILRDRAGVTEVVLIRRGKPPGQGQWNIPGGAQELGETVREAAIREAREETGATLADLALIDVVDGIWRNPDGSVSAHWTLVDFRARWASGELVAGDDAAEVRWVPLGQLDSYALWPETLRVITAGAAMP